MGAYLVERAMQSVLFGIGAVDFSTLNTIVLVLSFAALLACFIPAWRATRVDPMIALRHE